MTKKSSAKRKAERKALERKLETYIEDIKMGFDYVQSNYHPTWQDCYRIYRGRRVRVGYDGYSNAFVPETFTITESLVANIAGGKPKFNFLPTDEEQAQGVHVLNQLMYYIWDGNKMDQKSQIWVREMLQYGNGLLYVSWDDKRKMPLIMNIPIYDFIFDPTASRLENARFVGFRYLANKADLEDEMRLDPQTNEWVKKYDLSKLKDATIGSKGEQMDKEIKDMLQGSTVPNKATETQIEVVKLFYEDGTTAEIGNRAAVMYSGDTPYRQKERTESVETVMNGMPQTIEKTIPEIQPFYPFALLRDYVDPSLLLATGEIETIMDRQETLNDIENMDLDNAAYANNIMWQLDPQYIDLMPEITAAPGLVVPIPQGALQPIQRPPATVDLDNKKEEIKAEMRRATAADELIQGASQDQGRITATEVSTQLASSHQRFSTKLNNLESEGYSQLASVLLKVCQIFMTSEDVVRVIGKEGVAWTDFNPNVYSGEYEPHIKLDSTVKAAQIQEGQKLNQMFQLMLNNPHVDQREALMFIFTNLGADPDEIQKLLNVAPVAPTIVPDVRINLAGQLPSVATADFAAKAMGNQNAPTQSEGPGAPMAAPGIEPAPGGGPDGVPGVPMGAMGPAGNMGEGGMVPGPAETASDYTLNPVMPMSGSI